MAKPDKDDPKVKGRCPACGNNKNGPDWKLSGVRTVAGTLIGLSLIQLLRWTIPETGVTEGMYMGTMQMVERILLVVLGGGAALAGKAMGK